jgi:glycosyltransferase involved in cell wall biosynthesis
LRRVPASPHFSLFIPFCDERDLLPIAVDEALRVFGGLPGGFEMLLVDDGSSDGSEAIADTLAERHSQVRVVRHARRLGYGAVLTTGYRAARGEIIAYSDVDMPAPLEHFALALPLLDEADLVVGYPTGVSKPIHRHLYTWGYGWMVRTLLRLKVRDVNFSFKLLRRSLVDALKLGAETGFIDAELLAQARSLGGRRLEVAVPFQRRRSGRSHFDSPLVAWKTGAELVRYWRAQH